ncbi:MAG: hypothetical protein ACR2L2_14865 [Acidobacteriota bacterium]
MKPVQQTKVGPEEGNCRAAFLASMLEVSIDDIPDLGTGDGWLHQYADWMYQAHGRVLLHIWANYQIVPRGLPGIGGLEKIEDSTF